MKLNESGKSFEENYILPKVKLQEHSPSFNNYDNPFKSSKKKVNNSNNKIGEIRQLLNDMQKSPNRTINFSIILYLDENNYKRLPVEDIKDRLRQDYSNKPKMLINTTTNRPFQSEKKVIQSLHFSISRNKSFKIKTVNKIKYISLNETQALEYL